MARRERESGFLKRPFSADVGKTVAERFARWLEACEQLPERDAILDEYQRMCEEVANEVSVLRGVTSYSCRARFGLRTEGAICTSTTRYSNSAFRTRGARPGAARTLPEALTLG
jgi:hypothetical protein